MSLLRNGLAFLVGLLIGTFALSASAQNWDLPAELKALRASIEALSEKLNQDAVAGQPAPSAGPLLMLYSPDGTVIPAAATADGRLKVEIQTPVAK